MIFKINLNIEIILNLFTFCATVFIVVNMAMITVNASCL